MNSRARRRGRGGRRSGRLDERARGQHGEGELAQGWKRAERRRANFTGMAKIGRNDPCHCGSGVKYKKCHGAFNPSVVPSARPQPFNVRPLSLDDIPLDARIKLFQQMAEEARKETERLRKFGHVRAPMFVDYKGHKVVAVGNRLLWAKNWKTFHDFLTNYLAAVLTREWGNAEIARPFDQRHPIMQWYHLLCDFQRAHMMTDGQIHVATMSGPVKAYMALAYDLYTLEHHALLQERLVKRLKAKTQFQGARYETFVAAAFVRAGFDVTLEDETDSEVSHCEFNATHKRTRLQYSVEAKSRHRVGVLGQPGEGKPSSEIRSDVYKLLQRSLQKRAEYERIVCIDVNVPPIPNRSVHDLMKDLAEQMHKLEELQKADNPWPRAFVLFTNYPYHYVGNDTPEPGLTTVFSAINNPDWRQRDDMDATAQGAILAARYPALRDLVDSVMNHSEIPHDFEW